MLLDMNGILFAVQLVILLIAGPYADYGKWRPWILIGERAPPWQIRTHPVNSHDRHALDHHTGFLGSQES